jgi:hypothetical protein
MALDDSKVDSTSFYSEYHGHKVRHLERLLPKLRESSSNLIWTAGDSSLDNKHWFQSPRPAVGAYQDVLDPPVSNADVTYWLNYLCSPAECSPNNNPTRQAMATINTAVEATTLNERTLRLRPQDRFLRDNIQPDDILIVSIGGNDVALYPTPCTIASILGLICCIPSSCLEKGCVCGSVPVRTSIFSIIF